MINQLVEKLEKLLNQYNISNHEKRDIIEDYKQMIEDGNQKGLSQEAIVEMVGSPETIIKELGYERKELFPGGEKLIALSPFVSFIIFMILGLTKDLWHPGWLVFLFVPVVAIIVELGNSRDQYFLTALSPFIAGIVFFVVGFQYGIWHPTWLIFIVIPIFGIINSKEEMDTLTFFTALSPFFSFTAFILIGHFTGAYHYAWLILLLVVVFGIFHEKNNKNKVLLLTSLILSTILYLVIERYYGDWTIALIAFSILFITGLLTNNIQIQIKGLNNKLDLFIVLISLVLFIAVGYFFTLWAISWLFLFIIPIAMIIRYNEDSHTLTAISPFVSITIFILLGFYYHLWHISWIALLLIPIIAIIEDNDK